MKLTRYIHFIPAKQNEFDAAFAELVPKRIQFNAPVQANDLYMACLGAPHLSIVFCQLKDAQYVPQNIPAVIFGAKCEDRFDYNTLYVTTVDGFKDQIKAFLARLPRNIVVYPIVKAKSDVFWQHPVITEKYALRLAAAQNSKDIYVGIPYATLIDKNITPAVEIISLKLQIDAIKAENPAAKIITACQHIYYAKVLNIFKMLGITDLYISHKRNDDPDILDGINTHGLPLYPVNVFDHTRRAGIPEHFLTERPYLFSFIGAHMRHYLNPIRQKLLSWSSSTNYFIRDTHIWHFEKDVYQNQVRGAELTRRDKELTEKQTEEYNRILANSTFSLCPIGAGPNTIRLWESICTGSIPIIIADEFNIYKCIPGDIISDAFYIQLPYSSPHLESATALETYLRGIDKDAIHKMQAGCATVCTYLRDKFISLP